MWHDLRLQFVFPCFSSFHYHVYRNGEAITINGNHLSVPEVVAAGRYGAKVVLDDSPEVRSRIEKSQRAMDSKLESGKSVYGISTGFGGSGTFACHHIRRSGAYRPGALTRHFLPQRVLSRHPYERSSRPRQSPSSASACGRVTVRSILVRRSPIRRPHRNPQHA